MVALQGKMVALLRKLGVDYVLDTNLRRLDHRGEKAVNLLNVLPKELNLCRNLQAAARLGLSLWKLITK